MKKGALKVRIPNPHNKGDVGAALLKEILRQAGIEGDVWESSDLRPL
jgi:predicted RNA binding protein YcfA (HicA-like mRNA interferase family)